MPIMPRENINHSPLMVRGEPAPRPRRSSSPQRALLLLAALITSLALPACQGVTSPLGSQPMPAEHAHRLVADHNARVQSIDQLWARAVVEVTWRDENDQRRFRQGDGHLILRRPSELALSVGKLGNIMGWIGSDDHQFWYFELEPPRNQPTTAYLGLHQDIGKPSTRALPLPIRPDAIIELAGLTTLPDPSLAHWHSRPDDGGALWLTLPLDTGGHREIRLDPQTAFPTLIRYRDLTGNLTAESRLSDYTPMQTIGPYVPQRIEIRLPAQNARLVLFLSDAEDGKARKRVRDEQFNFERLVERLKPEQIQFLAPTHD